MEENIEMMAKIVLFVKEKREVMGLSQSELALRVFWK
jgi:ribosome-binding protein aMBF1 (putative translation factor)